MVNIKIKNGRIVEFESDARKIGRYFLYNNKALTLLELPKAVYISNAFSYRKEVLNKLYTLPN